MSDTKWTIWHTLGLFFTILLDIGIAAEAPTLPTRYMMWVWIVNMFLFLAFALIAGHGITGMLRGLFIDSQNTMSLSRLQMILWTILILSGYLAAVITNIHRGQPDALGITIPTEIWALMGISTTSLIGSPLIKSTKKDKPGNEDETKTTLALMAKQGTDNRQVVADGQLIKKTDVKYASWADLFKGEEVGNAAQLDIGKVQMLYFTLVVFSVYAVTLGSYFLGTTGKLNEFPTVNPSMLALLGISHGGYLINKAVPHSKSDEPSS